MLSHMLLHGSKAVIQSNVLYVEAFCLFKFSAISFWSNAMTTSPSSVHLYHTELLESGGNKVSEKRET